MGKKKNIPIENEEDTAGTRDEEAASEKTELAEEVSEKRPSETDRLRQELNDMRDEMLRMRAETENVRKRLQKDKQECVQFANEKLIRELIPIYDNLERALAAPDAGVESLKEGVQMIAGQILSLFKKENVEPIPAVGQPFDPSVHEVLSQIESHDHEEGMVIEEYTKGYRMNGRVLLPARVVTAKKPTNKEPGKKDPDNASTEAETQA